MIGRMTQEDWNKFYAEGEPTARGSFSAWSAWMREELHPDAVEPREREGYTEFLKKNLGVTYDAWLKNARTDL